MTTSPKEMLSTNSSQTYRMAYGRHILLNPLPEDFLRIDTDQVNIQVNTDHEIAASLQNQYNNQMGQYQELIVTFVEAKLVKNYGLMNMDPYVCLRVGHTVLKTNSSIRGGKNPRWNETLRCLLPKGINTLSIELYDSNSFIQDERIAWTTYRIPECYLNFSQNDMEPKNFEENIVLSGKQGHNKEGEMAVIFTINPKISSSQIRSIDTARLYNPSLAVIASSNVQPYQPIIVHQNSVPASTLLPENAEVQKRQYEEKVKTLREMFPKIELEVIKAVLSSERNNVDRAINHLLDLNTTTTSSSISDSINDLPPHSNIQSTSTHQV